MAKKLKNLILFARKLIKIDFSFELKSRFWARKFKYLKLSKVKYLSTSSNFGAKIQICLKVKF